MAVSKYVGSIGAKVEAQVKLVGIHKYTTNFSYYGETNYIYSMEDTEGNIFVWKTTSLLDVTAKNGEDLDFIRKGDTMCIRGTVKEHNEYNGTQQTVLTRCKYRLIEHCTDRIEAKVAEQMASLEKEDFIWDMPYRQYKEHYADCETVAGSYNKEEGTIKVIIRKGRLVNSGVRGKHFAGYQFSNAEGKWVTYRAVSEENARKQMLKDFPENTDWKCTKIYTWR